MIGLQIDSIVTEGGGYEIHFEGGRDVHGGNRRSGGKKRGGLLAATQRRLSTSMAVGLCCRPFHAVIVMGARVQIRVRTFLSLANSIRNGLGGRYIAGQDCCRTRWGKKAKLH